MPTYTFKCDKCMTKWDIKLTMSEHTLLKNSIHCKDCNEKATQMVAPLNFKLKGEGWFGKCSDAISDPYAITQTELNKNLEGEKRVEDYVNTMTARDENINEM